MFAKQSAKPASGKVARMRLSDAARSHDCEARQIWMLIRRTHAHREYESRRELAAALFANSCKIRLAPEPLPRTESHR